MPRLNIICWARSSPNEHGYFGVGSDRKIYFLDDHHLSANPSSKEIREAFAKYGYEDIPICRGSRMSLARALALAS